MTSSLHGQPGLGEGGDDVRFGKTDERHADTPWPAGSSVVTMGAERTCEPSRRLQA
jgi:hypothetical protein